MLHTARSFCSHGSESDPCGVLRHPRRRGLCPDQPGLGQERARPNVLKAQLQNLDGGWPSARALIGVSLSPLPDSPTRVSNAGPPERAHPRLDLPQYRGRCREAAHPPDSRSTGTPRPDGTFTASLPLPSRHVPISLCPSSPSPHIRSYCCALLPSSLLFPFWFLRSPFFSILPTVILSWPESRSRPLSRDPPCPRPDLPKASFAERRRELGLWRPRRRQERAVCSEVPHPPPLSCLGLLRMCCLSVAFVHFTPLVAPPSPLQPRGHSFLSLRLPPPFPLHCVGPPPHPCVFPSLCSVMSCDFTPPVATHVFPASPRHWPAELPLRLFRHSCSSPLACLGEGIKAHPSPLSLSPRSR